MWVNRVLHCCKCNSPFLCIVVNTASLLHEAVKHSIVYNKTVKFDIFMNVVFNYMVAVLLLDNMFYV